MRTVQYLCRNEDSCAPGTIHHFPEIGEPVAILRRSILAREAGTENVRRIHRCESLVIHDILADAHQVVVKLNDRLYFIDSDDIVGK